VSWAVVWAARGSVGVVRRGLRGAYLHRLDSFSLGDRGVTRIATVRLGFNTNTGASVCTSFRGLGWRCSERGRVGGEYRRWSRGSGSPWRERVSWAVVWAAWGSVGMVRRGLR